VTRLPRQWWVALVIALTGACGCDAPAEAPTTTDIWVVDLMSAGGLVALGTPVNVTARDGYDNQPSFLPDGTTLLYSSRRGNQVDVFSLDLDSGDRRRMAATLESEYSPTSAPDASGITVVRVERDGRQRLWTFPFDGGTPRSVLEGVNYVAYYAWIDANTIALSILGEPPTLQVADLTDGSLRLLRDEVGRSLQPVPGRRAIAYVHRPATGQASIREWDLDDDTDRLLAPTVGDGQDFVWMPDGQLLMARGTELLVFTPGTSGEWSPLADFANDGLGPISRIAVSDRGDRLALVAPEL